MDQPRNVKIDPNLLTRCDQIRPNRERERGYGTTDRHLDETNYRVRLLFVDAEWREFSSTVRSFAAETCRRWSNRNLNGNIPWTLLLTGQNMMDAISILSQRWHRFQVGEHFDSYRNRLMRWGVLATVVTSWEGTTMWGEKTSNG